ncbi:hypothetical protein AJ80_08180 [Polytolypa hystricis UAMH7299]|uniref:Uncharacterized protein n=1 Tax=Polytolypa hystricis (strain UAMH7299) TaxID=1447883 RepID=A0A2B7XB73_POLH7|nr:hypothetical protein AJ80_08180 [Polytolypa hystricis UAMH7299]
MQTSPFRILLFLQVFFVAAIFAEKYTFAPGQVVDTRISGAVARSDISPRADSLEEGSIIDADPSQMIPAVLPDGVNGWENGNNKSNEENEDDDDPTDFDEPKGSSVNTTVSSTAGRRSHARSLLGKRTCPVDRSTLCEGKICINKWMTMCCKGGSEGGGITTTLKEGEKSTWSDEGAAQLPPAKYMPVNGRAASP